MRTTTLTRVDGLRFVVIGGGTGSFTLLSGLKNFVRNITALVNMSDSGGSTGTLRDELGVLPPGDVRQCLTALSDIGEARELFTYRFEEGTLAGHSFGNLFLAAAEKMTGSFEDGVQLVSRMLQTAGTVEPITNMSVHVRMMTSHGTIVEGEHLISEQNFGSCRPDVWLEPKASITSRSRESLLNADMIVIAQGNLYGSIAPALVVDGVGETIAESNAQVVYVSNLVTKAGQTDGFTVVDYADEVERFAGSPILDTVLYNTNLPDHDLLAKYAAAGEHPVRPGRTINARRWEAVGADLLSPDIHFPSSSAADPLSASRTLIRHDSDVVVCYLMKVYFS